MLDIEILEFGLNYYWHDRLNGIKRKQQVSLEPLSWSASDRGNYRAAYDVVCRFDAQIRLTNYYFSEEIAKAEILIWSQIISKTLPKNLIQVKKLDIKTEIENNYFRITSETKQLVFDDGYFFDYFVFDAIPKVDLCSIDCCDLFPRSYTIPEAMASEINDWLEIWGDRYS